MTFDQTKAKKQYQNGISHIKKSAISKENIIKYDEWSILAPTGDLIGFISLEHGSHLPPEIWIRDKKYKIAEKINKD